MRIKVINLLNADLYKLVCSYVPVTAKANKNLSFECKGKLFYLETAKWKRLFYSELCYISQRQKQVQPQVLVIAQTTLETFRKSSLCLFPRALKPNKCQNDRFFGKIRFEPMTLRSLFNYANHQTTTTAQQYPGSEKLDFKKITRKCNQ